MRSASQELLWRIQMLNRPLTWLQLLNIHRTIARAAAKAARQRISTDPRYCGIFPLTIRPISYIMLTKK